MVAAVKVNIRVCVHVYRGYTIQRLTAVKHRVLNLRTLMYILRYSARILNSLPHSTPPSKISLSSASPDEVLSLPSQSSVSHSDSIGYTNNQHPSSKEADNEYRKNAERMKIQYAKRKRHQIKTYSAGECHSIRIPKNERSSTDMPRLLCYILEAKMIITAFLEFFFVCVCLFIYIYMYV